MFVLRGIASAALASLLVACGAPAPELDYSGPTADWPFWGGDIGASHFSPATQIDPSNVAHLEPVWEHRSGDFFDGSGSSTYTALQVTPIVVNDLLYYCTPFMRVFALDPETGEERWRFDPELKARGSGGPYPLTCRGVSYWQAQNPLPGRACDKRIFLGTKDSELIALDADTGKPCQDFGTAGRLALRESMGDAEPWEYYPTSPPLIIGDRVVLGALVADNVRTDIPSGVVRAFDVRSGARVWAWDPVPPGWDWQRSGKDGKWAPGSPNVWSIITADRERNLVFVPTGNPSPDIYGGQRNGIDFYGSSTVALDATTGAVRWHFQSVHHDVWDYDTPSPPTLFQIDGVGGGRPGVAQTTKMGFVFLLDRETGEPLYPVEERPVPQGGVPGESLSPTQPFPTHPGPLHPLELSADNVFGFTFFERMGCQDEFAKYRWDGIYTPPSLEGSIQYPNTSGGMNWGGVAIDAQRGLLIVNQTHVAMMVQLIAREDVGSIDPAELQYPNEFYPMEGTPYAVRRSPLFSPFGAPCNPPPWGTLTAVDLRTGEVAWRRPFGSTKGTAPPPMWIDMGTPNFGGGMATASGLYFIGATLDREFHAIDSETGEELWSHPLPFAGTAVPMSYRLRPDSKQYVVIAAGANPLSEMGDALMAFALPD